jgi:uncharacterized protein with GYD domain
VPQVFISYGREDQDAARRLFRDLARVGVGPWLDVEKLRPGDHWKSATLTALRSSDYVVLLMSTRTTGRRGFLNTEIREALEVVSEMPHNRPFLLPARLDDCTPSHESLNELHWVDLFPAWAEGLVRIIDVVADRTAPSDAESARQVGACILLRAKPGREAKVREFLVKARPDSRSFYCFGQYDFMLFCEEPDIEALERSVVQLREMLDITDSQTVIGVPLRRIPENGTND